MATSDEIAAAQREEAKHARTSAQADKKSAAAEHDSAQAQKGEHRVKQPDDYSIL